MKTGANKTIFYISCYLFFSVICLSASSQIKPKVKKTFRADFELPKPLSNRALDSLFKGVYNVNLSMNFGVKNLNGGVYAGMMQCQIFPKYEFQPHSIQTVYSTGVRFSYDRYPSKEKIQSTEGSFFVFSPFISVG